MSFGGLERPRNRENKTAKPYPIFWRSSSHLGVFTCSKTPGFPPFIVKAAINSANFSLHTFFWRK